MSGWRSVVRGGCEPAAPPTSSLATNHQLLTTSVHASEQQLLDLNQKLLSAIVSGDWKTYAELCDPSITCFEAESHGELVIGMPFHKFYFDLPGPTTPKVAKVVTMSQPHVRIMGDAAIVAYVRLTQGVDAAGAPTTGRAEETRIWQKIGGAWKHVHFHRSNSA